MTSLKSSQGPWCRTMAGRSTALQPWKRVDEQLPHRRDRLHARYDFQKALAIVRRPQKKTTQAHQCRSTLFVFSSTKSDGTSSSEFQLASQEVWHSHGLCEWSARSGLQNPDGTGERGRNTPPIAGCTKLWMYLS